MEESYLKGEVKMVNCPIDQLKTIILLRQLNRLNVFCEEEVVACRIKELSTEHLKNQEHRELYGEYSKLFDRIQDIDDKEQRNRVLFEFDDLIGAILAETEKFYYLAGFHDAIRDFNIS
jgi:hypothetical protein